MGGNTSANCPPNIQGLAEAAVTLKLNKINSNTVNCGRCPAKLSNKFISISKLDNAANTCSSRFDEDVTIFRVPVLPLPLPCCCLCLL